MKKILKTLGIIVGIVIGILFIYILIDAIKMWKFSKSDKMSNMKLDANKLVFYNDIEDIQIKVKRKIIESELAGKSKYEGLISNKFIDSQTGEINNNIEPTKVLNINGEEKKIYALLESCVEELGLLLDKEEIQNFAIDEEGKVYFYKGLILDPKNKDIANVAPNLTITSTKESINIADY